MDNDQPEWRPGKQLDGTRPSQKGQVPAWVEEAAKEPKEVTGES